MNWTENALEFIKWLSLVIVAILCWLFKEHEMRLRMLETTGENKADATRQRAELRQELHDFRNETRAKLDDLQSDTNAKREEIRRELVAHRTEIGDRLETVRVETNEKLDKLFDQIAQLASTYARASRKR